MIKLIIETVETLTNNISLISATKEDLDLIIEAELFTTKASYTDGKIPKDVKDEIIQDAKDSIEHTRMITYNDEIIGILQAYELEGYWYIGEIYLIEEYRGQGIGRDVLEYEINNHKDMTICLNVYKNNTHAIELYKSLGFEVTEDSDGRYIMKLFPKSLENYKFLKLHIKETYELKESNRPNVFDNNSRETYGNLINPNSKVGNVTTHDYYKFEKGEDARLTYMTTDEYINKCINDIFKSNYDKVVTHAIHWDKVDKYAELMKQGVKFPTPYLNYKNKGQEGRHRALAFAKAFGDDAEMPVIEIFPTEVTDDEIFNYCQERWGDGKQWFSYVAYKLGRTEKEVCDYLGITYNKPAEDSEDEDDTALDFDISDEDMLDDEYEMDEFEEFVREQSGGKVQNVFSLPADEFMKWMTKFTKYNS